MHGIKIAMAHNAQVSSPATDFMLGMGMVYNTDVQIALGVSFGSFDGYWPFSPTATLIGSQATTPTYPSPLPMTAAYGVDFTGISFSGAAFRSTGFSVDGAGNLSTNGLTVSAGSVTLPNNSITWAALPSEVQQVPVAFAFSGNPALNARVNVPVTMAMTEPGLTGTYVKVYASTAPTGAPVFTLYRVIGGAGAPISIGTITWTAASQNSATFAGAGASLAAGDVLQLVCTTADAAIAEVGITVQCARV
jgi:hypothetical protein